MHAAMRTKRRKQKGIALISTVWIALFLAVSAAALSISARNQGAFVRGNADRLAARELAAAAAEIGLNEIIRSGTDNRAPRDGRPVSLALAGGTAILRIQDEAGKIDINAAPIELLKPFFIAIGKQTGLDAFAASSLAERIAGKPAASADEAPDRMRLQSIAALRSVEGVTEDFYRAVEPHATVYSAKPTVNPMTATRGVLSSMPGMDPGSVARLIAVREAGEQRPAFEMAETFFSDAEEPVYSIIGEGLTASGARARITLVVAVPGSSVTSSNKTFRIIEMR
jgi:general secretion pathway protein K